MMSVQQFFSETEAVVQVLSELAGDIEDPSLPVELDEEEFAAIWQAAELLSRAYSVLLPMVQFEQSKHALNLPDVQVKNEHPKQKKAARLYDAQGKPLA